MHYRYFEDTIAAISTPTGSGAIGIIRLSGLQALSILEKVWQGETPVAHFEPRRVYVGLIRTPTIADHILTFWMKAPHSYTGEDIVEIQGHGGSAVLELLLQSFLKAGARLAEPGEFTKRAFLNGRIDLTQAEGVADLIQATQGQAAQQAIRQVEGRLSEYIGQLRNDLKVMRAQMEAMIDFPEDGDIQELRLGYHHEMEERIGIICGKIQKLLSTYEEGRLMREGLRVAIVGKPNVGKSSLFNAFLNTNRAIVHPTPGTTRDLIEEVLELEGLTVRFIDTAGIRETEEGIESEGIRRTHERLKQADLILAVFDASRPISSEDKTVLETLQGLKTILIRNKCDLPSAWETQALQSPLHKYFPISAKEGTGIDRLKKKMVSTFLKESDVETDLILTNLRHRTALEKGHAALSKAMEGCAEKRSLELLVADLAEGMDHLGEITGEVTNDEILGEIFSKFCIGK